MAFETTELESDLEEIEGDLPETFTWSGSSYACVSSELGHDHEMADLAGYSDNRTVRLTARQSLFTTLPAVGDQLTFSGNTWRIVATEDDPSGVAINLICEEQTA